MEQNLTCGWQNLFGDKNAEIILRSKLAKRIKSNGEYKHVWTNFLHSNYHKKYCYFSSENKEKLLLYNEWSSLNKVYFELFLSLLQGFLYAQHYVKNISHTRKCTLLTHFPNKTWCHYKKF